ncbi:MAG: hypothetical protein ABI382_08425 [Nakamurella sp.]
MANSSTHSASSTGGKRRSTDIVALIAAFVLLAIAAIGISGDTWWLIPHLLPWAAAGVVALTGLGLIVSSLPRRGRSR